MLDVVDDNYVIVIDHQSLGATRTLHLLNSLRLAQNYEVNCSQYSFKDFAVTRYPIKTFIKPIMSYGVTEQ